ncbi:MAG: hypothetical protein P8Y25_07970, partial [Chromatiaceae bacterium]
ISGSVVHPASRGHLAAASVLLWDLVCSEREPKALAVVSKREPEPGAVGEPEDFCLKAATVGVENHPDL